MFKDKSSSHRCYGVYISLHFIEERDLCSDIIRVGFAVGKKLGCATKRNKIKRRLRMIARAVILDVDFIGYYYAIVANKNIMQASYEKLQKDLTLCLKKIK